MCQKEIAEKIKQKALELGFEGCGIVKFGKLRAYEEKLDKRIEACPASKPIIPFKKTKRHMLI